MTEERSYLYEAPAKILELLTPPSSQQGQRWRENAGKISKKQRETQNPSAQISLFD